MSLSEEILTFKPMIREGFITYFRDEGNGNFSYRFKNSLSGEVLLNITFKEIIGQLDGKTSVGSIINHIVSLYKDAPKDLVSRDVLHILKKLIEWQGIEWKGENPLLNNKKIEIADGITLSIMNYLDQGEIHNFIKSVNDDKEKYFTYFNTVLLGLEFNEHLIVKAQMGKQVCFGVKRNDKLIGLIIFENDRNIITRIKFAAFSKEIRDVEKCIKTAMSEMAQIYSIKTKCFKVHIREKEDSTIRNCFKKLEFNKAIFLKNELGQGIDVEELSCFNF